MTKNELEKWMSLALSEAKNGQGFVSPNPMVGAVLVKDGKLLAKGYHRGYGSKHAEVECLESYGKEIIGDEVLFVTLEPCFHFGKQPPCVDYVLRKGVKNLVIGTTDPNPLVSGKSIKKLQNQGVNVTTGVLESSCKELIKHFSKAITKNLPYTVLKVAMTMTGQIAPLPLQRVQITSELTKTKLSELRSRLDAIIVGKNTLLVDNPNLGVNSGNSYQPLRVCWGNIDIAKTKNYQFFRDDNFKIVPSGNPKILLNELKLLGINSVLIEGGARVLQSFFDDGLNLIDELWVFVSKKCSPFDDGLMAFSKLPQDLRELNGWDFTFEEVGDDNLLIWRLK